MPINTIQTYLDRVIPEHKGKPNFMAVLAAYLQPFVDGQAALAALVDDFDIDLAAGAQLDVLGLFVGVSRDLPTPIPSPYFALDVPGRGLDTAPILQYPMPDPTMITALDDGTYRRLLKARIAANDSDGSITDALTILRTFLDDPGITVWIQDGAVVANEKDFFALDVPGLGLDGPAVLAGDGATRISIPNPDMCFAVVVAGTIGSSILDLVVLDQGLLPIKPAGVRMDICVAARNVPLFGLDRSDDLVAGLDVGALGTSPREALRVAIGE